MKHCHGKMRAMTASMDRSNFQKLLGAMCATGLFAVLHFIGEKGPLALSLEIAIWLFALSFPIHAASIAGDAAWFQRTFFSPEKRLQTVILLASILMYIVGVSSLLFYVRPLYGMVFFVVAAGCTSALLAKHFDDPSQDEST